MEILEAVIVGLWNSRMIVASDSINGDLAILLRKSQGYNELLETYNPNSSHRIVLFGKDLNPTAPRLLEIFKSWKKL